MIVFWVQVGWLIDVRLDMSVDVKLALGEAFICSRLLFMAYTCQKGQILLLSHSQGYSVLLSGFLQVIRGTLEQVFAAAVSKLEKKMEILKVQGNTNILAIKPTNILAIKPISYISDTLLAYE